jgi:hypothetical protein
MITPDEDSLHSLVQDVLYWGAVAAACALTLVAAIGISGYAYARWFA